MQTQYADVIVDIRHEKLDRSFQYRVPASMADAIRVGSCVRIPFGNSGRVIDGYVLGFSNEPHIAEEKIKDIAGPTKGSATVEGKLISLAAWIRETYGSTMIQALKTVLPVKRDRRRGQPVDPFAALRELPRTEESSTAALTPEQQSVREAILSEWSGRDRPCLIRGITGSGKTHVYRSLIEETLARGKQAIVLIPEIALSWQTVRRFYARFGDRIALIHSRMTPAERADQFARVRAGDAEIVIGPRSALFAPFADLGLIIVDEEHETAYASEMTPRYHARETAVARAEIEDAHVVLGSATPSVDARYRCETGEYRLLELNERYGEAMLPKVHIVDLREELRDGNRGLLSKPLAQAIAGRLAAGEQTMLFLNRRGHTGFFSCRSCGHVVKCPHCDVSLTSHRGGRLVCHYCGHTEQAVQTCPSCGSRYIKGFQAGTEKVEQEVIRTFPGARVLRMDADSTRRKGSYEEILRAFAEGEADILVGTQMIVKGHDFPKVTLVGAIAADLSLFASDYRSAERTYQLLVQAVGRAGRGARGGEAIIQTYHPEHYSIQAATRQDYESFYEEEIAARELCGYPPASNLLAVHGTGQDEKQLDTAMEYIRRFVERIRRHDTTQLLGPAPEAVSKLRDTYRRVFYIKETDAGELLRLRTELERYIEINRGFDEIRLQYDFNQ